MALPIVEDKIQKYKIWKSIEILNEFWKNDRNWYDFDGFERQNLKNCLILLGISLLNNSALLARKVRNLNGSFTSLLTRSIAS